MTIASKARIAVAALSLSAAAFVGITTREGYTDHAIIPVPGDVPTMGFGTTEDVKMGDRTNPVQAVQRALKDATKYEGAVRGCVKAPLHQFEFDAYTDLAYNIGPSAFCASTIAKRLNANPPDYDGACDAILMWKRYKDQDCSAPGNRVCAGLWRDRLRVQALCKGKA